MSTSLNVHTRANPMVTIEVDEQGPTTITLLTRSGDGVEYESHLIHTFVERTMTAEGWRHFASSAAKASEMAFAKANEMNEEVE